MALRQSSLGYHNASGPVPWTPYIAPVWGGECACHASASAFENSSSLPLSAGTLNHNRAGRQAGRPPHPPQFRKPTALRGPVIWQDWANHSTFSRQGVQCAMRNIFKISKCGAACLSLLFFSFFKVDLTPDLQLKGSPLTVSLRRAMGVELY